MQRSEGSKQFPRRSSKALNPIRSCASSGRTANRGEGEEGSRRIGYQRQGRQIARRGENVLFARASTAEPYILARDLESLTDGFQRRGQGPGGKDTGGRCRGRTTALCLLVVKQTANARSNTRGCVCTSGDVRLGAGQRGTAICYEGTGAGLSSFLARTTLPPTARKSSSSLPGYAFTGVVYGHAVSPLLFLGPMGPRRRETLDDERGSRSYA